MSTFSTFRFRPVELDTLDFSVETGEQDEWGYRRYHLEDTGIGTLIEVNDLTSGKTSYRIEAGDQREEYTGDGSYNNEQWRALYLVRVSGLKDFRRGGYGGSFCKIRRSAEGSQA